MHFSCRTLVTLLLPLLWGAMPCIAADPSPFDDDRFEFTELAAGMPQPLEIDLAPDGRLFLIELRGKVKAWKPDAKQLVDVGEIPVFTDQENGLLGVALDPDFAKNGWVYFQYSPKDFSGQYISRFNIVGDKLDMSSEKRLLKFEEQRKECCHHAGSMAFGPDGSLYFSTGDNTHPHGDSEGFAPIDERAGREPWDAQKSSANTHDLRGKIIRIKPTPEGSYTIPDGNLFPKDGSKGRPEIFVMGCRNPWKMNVDPRTGYVYWGEVGPDSGGDGPRGSRGYDEINQAKKAGNFGWPYFVGPNAPYFDYDFATKKVGAKFDPAKPINEGPNNTGAKELPPAQPAWIYYPYGDSKEFPMLGKGGRTACAGPVYHHDPKAHAAHGFPAHFDNCLIIYDWQRPFLKWARLDKDSNLVGIEPFVPKLAFKRPCDFKFAPDGTLYMLEFGAGWGPNADSRLLHITYERGNRAPIAKAGATNNIGKAPLKVALSSAGTSDKDTKDKLTYRWRAISTVPQAAAPTGAAQPAGAPVAAPKTIERELSNEANPTVSFDQAGVYTVELTVTDPHGASSTAAVPVLVGNAPPVVKFESPREGDFVDPQRSVHFKVAITDAEDGTSDYEDAAMGPRTVVTAALKSAGSGSDDPPGLQLMKRSDCFNCHAPDRRVVGPALLEIAQKYKGDAKALELAAERVIKGSGGVWGVQAHMLPHSQHTMEQTRQMVAWIFDMKPDAATAQTVKGVFGAIPLPKSAATGGAGFVLEATYTDSGGGPVGPLTGRGSVTVRLPTIEAESADGIHGPQKLGGKTAGGGVFLGAINHGHFARFDRINLTNVEKITCRVASGGVGGGIEFRADKPDGKLLASVEVKPTGGWETWTELSVPLKHQGITALHVVFTHPSKAGGLMNLDSLKFGLQGEK